MKETPYTVGDFIEDIKTRHAWFTADKEMTKEESAVVEEFKEYLIKTAGVTVD